MGFASVAEYIFEGLVSDNDKSYCEIMKAFSGYSFFFFFFFFEGSGYSLILGFSVPQFG